MIDFPTNPTVGQTFTTAGVTWVWDGVKWTTAASAAGTVGYLPLAGGTLTGPLNLAADPSNDLEAATKEYVDNSSGAVTLSDTPPLNAKTGALWWDTVSGSLFVWYNDGTTAQWVAASNGFFTVPGFLPLAGGTLTGGLDITTTGAALTVTSTSGDSAVIIDKPGSGTDAYISGYNTGLPRWVVELGGRNPETGSNAGSDFDILAYDDTGAYINNPLVITRADGHTTLNSLGDDPLTLSGIGPMGYTRILYKTAAGYYWSCGVTPNNDFAIANEAAGAFNLRISGTGISYPWLGSTSHAFSYDGGSWHLYTTINGGYVIGDNSNVMLSFGTSTYTSIAAMALNGAAGLVYAWYSPGGAWSWSNGASDIRLKSNITPGVKDALAAINEINIVECDMTQPFPGAKPQHWKWAIISNEELEKTIPQAHIPAEEHTYASIRDLPIIAALVKSVQQLTAKVETLEAARGT